MKFNCVLFDLDGTLLDTSGDLGAALNFVATQYGKATIAPELYIPESSNGSKGLLKLAFGEHFNGYDFEVLKARFLAFYGENIAVHTRLFDKVAVTLDYLDQNHIPWGIVTNKPAALTNELLKHFAQLKHCRAVVGGDTLAVRKPDPQPLLHALEALDMPIRDCLYVGDAERDIAAGRNAGMKTAAALYGYINATDNVAQWQADYHFDALDELIGLMNCP